MYLDFLITALGILGGISVRKEQVQDSHLSLGEKAVPCCKSPGAQPFTCPLSQKIWEQGCDLHLSWEKVPRRQMLYVEELAATKQMKRTGMPHLANRTLSLSSLPHSQLFPGSTAKCKGSSLCSESVSGITAGGGKTCHQGVSPRREEGKWTQTDWYYRRYDNCSHFSFLTCELSWHLKLKGWLSLNTQHII